MSVFSETTVTTMGISMVARTAIIVSLLVGIYYYTDSPLKLCIQGQVYHPLASGQSPPTPQNTGTSAAMVMALVIAG